jgi:hypothetical protein
VVFNVDMLIGCTITIFTLKTVRKKKQHSGYRAFNSTTTNSTHNETGHEVDHPHSSSAKVKNMQKYTSTPPYVFMV